MALKKTMKLSGPATVQLGDVSCFVENFEQVFANSYIKVISVNGDKNVVSANVGFFSGDKKMFEKNYPFTPSMDEANFIKQAYEYLKTLPEFEGATDC